MTIIARVHGMLHLTDRYNSAVGVQKAAEKFQQKFNLFLLAYCGANHSSLRNYI